MRRALALLILLAACGCSRRDRANPLDPSNPGTGGRPAGFAALAGNAQVFLQWSGPVGATGVEFTLEREAEGEADFTPLAPTLRAGTTAYLDLGVANDVTYRYRLRFLANGTTSPPAEDAATPSRVIPWVIDDGRHSLVRLSADARHIATEEPDFPSPSAIAIDRGNEKIWIADPAGSVVIFTPAIGGQVSVTNFISPQFLAVDPRTGTAWITDFEAGNLRSVLSNGANALPSIGPLDHPLGIDVDPGNGTVWVCERGGNQVRRYAADGTPLLSPFLASPSRVAVDSTTGDAWVTAFTAQLLVHFSSAGVALDTITGLAGPVGVAVDTYRGRIWVTDPVAAQVIAFRRDGSEEFRVGGMTGAVALAIEPGSGEAWVVVTGAIVRVSSSGHTILSSTGLGAPTGIALDRFSR